MSQSSVRPIQAVRPTGAARLSRAPSTLMPRFRDCDTAATGPRRSVVTRSGGGSAPGPAGGYAAEQPRRRPGRPTQAPWLMGFGAGNPVSLRDRVHDALVVDLQGDAAVRRTGRG